MAMGSDPIEYYRTTTQEDIEWSNSKQIFQFCSTRLLTLGIICLNRKIPINTLLYMLWYISIISKKTMEY